MTDYPEGLTLFVNEVPPKKGTFRMEINYSKFHTKSRTFYGWMRGKLVNHNFNAVFGMDGFKAGGKNEKINKIAKRKLYCRRTSYQMTSFCFSKKQLEYNYISLLARLQWQIQVCDYVMVKPTFYSNLSRLGGWCVPPAPRWHLPSQKRKHPLFVQIMWTTSLPFTF